MNESDLVTLCIQMASSQTEEFRLTGFFDVYVTTQNYNAITDFICHYAGVFI